MDTQASLLAALFLLASEMGVLSLPLLESKENESSNIPGALARAAINEKTAESQMANTTALTLEITENIGNSSVDQEKINETGSHNASEKDPIAVKENKDDVKNRTKLFQMPPSPELPDLPAHDRKANITGPEDPYIAAPVHRLCYENITYVKNSSGQNILVGSGSFGSVYLAMYKETYPVIVKVFHKHTAKNTTKKRLKQTFHEARLSAMLQPTGLLPKFYGLVRTEIDGEVEFGLVHEYYANGMTVLKLLTDNNSPELENGLQPDWLQICLKLVQSIDRLHKEDVLFNDIKLANMLVDMSGREPEVKLIDVGSASYRRPHMYRAVPPEERKRFFHLAPEVLDDVPTSVNSDVYSICKALRRVMAFKPISDELTRYASYCLDADPKDRPTIPDIIDKLHMIISDTTDSTLTKLLNKKDEFEFTHKEFLFGLTLSPFFALAVVVVKGLYYRKHHLAYKQHSL
ncbi:dual specificity protein kinase shkC isoform X1 [Lingula anatina]|uniref:Dual specificity protein kinase shkC isoform X1 n=1 Tax=Lingula anatina TaxID=7574 RepID=A0A1S3HNX3_LINAN|nr:dual specificity protein kinase shkC isoform X1 [Lingula anatina]|eukprot:XP_013387748.1 dual specificity protein kinase shkC isoform X1 [Lingula anatina]